MNDPAMLTQADPLVTVVVPTYNRPQQVNRLVQALCNQTRCEIIVVDDGSLPAIELSGILDQVRVIRQENAGAAAARNRGLAEARGRYIAFMDDDCLPHSDWLRQLVSAAEAYPGAMVGGHTRNALPDNLYAAASQLIVDLSFEYYGTGDDETFLTSNNVLMPIAALRELGGFDSRYRCAGGEDRDLCYRWQQQGYSLHYVPDAIVDHYHHLTLWTFCKQHFCYGMGAYRYRRTRARQRPKSLRQEYRFLLDIRHWLGYPLRRLAGRQRYLVVGLFLVWQIANTAGFIWQAVNEQVR